MRPIQFDNLPGRKADNSLTRVRALENGRVRSVRV